MPHSIKQLEMSIDSCISGIKDKKKEIVSAVGDSKFKFDYNYMGFISSLVKRNEESLQHHKAQFVIMKQVLDCSIAITERELKRRQYQEELNILAKRREDKLVQVVKKIQKRNRRGLKSYQSIGTLSSESSSSSQETTSQEVTPIIEEIN